MLSYVYNVTECYDMHCTHLYLFICILEEKLNLMYFCELIFTIQILYQ